MTAAWWLVPVGLAVGLFGTLIGAGGGFLLVPILLLAFPGRAPELLTSISLAVVVANAAAGTASYARLGRIDYRSGLLFAAATIPGAVLGALSTALFPRRTFEIAFALFLIAGSAYLVWRPLKAPAPAAAARGVRRELTDSSGAVHVWHFRPWVGVTISVGVGFLSSLFGIGGGIIHVPVLSHLLDFPVHIATATSQFTLAIMALAGTLVHLATGTLQDGLAPAALLALGAVAGAPLGAALSRRVHGSVIMRVLAVALGLVGVRILLGAL